MKQQGWILALTLLWVQSLWALGFLVIAQSSAVRQYCLERLTQQENKTLDDEDEKENLCDTLPL